MTPKVLSTVIPDLKLVVGDAVVVRMVFGVAGVLTVVPTELLTSKLVLGEEKVEKLKLLMTGVLTVTLELLTKEVMLAVEDTLLV